MRRSYTFPVIMVLVLAAALSGCSRGQSTGGRANAGTTVGVRIIAAQQETTRRRLQAVGSLFALDESIISSQVEGEVRRVLVDVGDEVREGQVLVTIEPTELQYAVETQRSAVGQVRAQLGIGPNEAPPSDPSKVALVQRAAADLLEARRNYERAGALFQDRLISREAYDATAARYENTKAGHALALQQVDQLIAQLQSSEATRRLAEKKLADASIRAPYSGSVKERRISPGEYVGVHTPVMVVVRTSQLRARLAVPEKWAGHVKEGSVLDIHVDAFPDEVFKGRLERINPSVNPESRTFEVEALIPNAVNRLKPGFFVEAVLPSEAQDQIVTIPMDAMTYTFGAYKVYVVDGDRVKERMIKPGTQTATPDGVRVEILEGLKAGERLALAVAGSTLQDGAAIHEESR